MTLSRRFRRRRVAAVEGSRDFRLSLPRVLAINAARATPRFCVGGFIHYSHAERAVFRQT